MKVLNYIFKLFLFPFVFFFKKARLNFSGECENAYRLRRLPSAYRRGKRILSALTITFSLSAYGITLTDDFEADNGGWSAGTTILYYGEPINSNVLRVDLNSAWVTKTYDFGSENANKPVRIEFDMWAVGGWESSGSYIDYFAVSTDGNNFLYNDVIPGTDGTANVVYKHFSLTGTTDANGRLILYFAQIVSAIDTERAHIDNITLEVIEGINNNYRDFELRYQDIFRGKMVTIGNTILVAPDPQSTANCATYTNGPYLSDASDTNDNYQLCAYHNDTSVNFSTTSATLPINNPDDIEIAWAGLYWQALVANTQDVTNMQIKIKHDNETYRTISYDHLDWLDGSGKEGYISYSAFADITDLFVSNGWKNGTITVGNIPVYEGQVDNLGTYGAWTLVVVYKDPHEKNRIFSIYDGWQVVSKDFPSTNISLSGFLTPKNRPIESTVSVFAAEGDKFIENDYLEAWSSEENKWITLTHTVHQTFNSSIDTFIPFTRVPNPVNNQGIDIQSFNIGDGGYDIMKPMQTSMDFRFYSNADGNDQDTYWPSMIAFETELLAPDLCYDYAYKQNNRYFTEENDGTKDPRIKGKLFSQDPVEVSVFFKNREDSDFIIQNLTMNVGPIDTAQASYINNTAQVILPGETIRHSATIDSSSESAINGIQIGTVGGKEYFYTYYSLDPKVYSLDIPLNVSVDYNATITTPAGTTVTIPFNNQILNSTIPLCVDGNFSYAPIYGIFNVEQDIAGEGNYNIYTQVARRPENFKVKAYDASNTDTPTNVSTIVAVELIDAGAYHETQTSCNEPDSALTPRVWVIFDDNVSEVDFTKKVIDAAIANGLVSDRILNRPDQIESAEDYYGVVRRNTAFRISYVDFGDGKSPLVDKNNNGSYTMLNWRTEWSGWNCSVPMDPTGNSGNDDKVSSYCNDTGNNPNTLAECMECVYGYGIRYVCSRDNFAIRPEALKVSFSDDNTSTLNADFANNTDKAGAVDQRIGLVAGYPYRIDINATSYTDEAPVSGYTQFFDSSDPTKRAYMAWKPNSSATACNSPEDSNMTFSLVNGTNTNDNPINTWEDRHDTLSNVGEYEFVIFDREWTKYDWDENLTRHHTGAHFTTGPDCIKGTGDDTIVPSVSSMVGCDISSVHTASYQTYREMLIRSYPYAFDVSGLSFGGGPNRNSRVVYFNTLDSTQNYPNGYKNTEDKNMSYNVQGTFFAADYNGNRLDNFVNNCYADNVNLSIQHTYLSTVPNSNDDLTYDLIEYNTNNPTVITRPREQATPDISHTIDQNDSIVIAHTPSDFSYGMKGAVTMDLGLNFNRSINPTLNSDLNPRLINFADLNVTLTPSGTINNRVFVDGTEKSVLFGDRDDLDQNVTFAYARVASEQYFYDNITTDSIKTPISVEIYCDLGFTECQNRGLDLTNAQTKHAFWWKAVSFDNVTQNDGNVRLKVGTPLEGAGNPALNTTDVNIISNGTDSNVNVTANATSRPLTVPILLDTDITLPGYTDRWLIHNPDANGIPSPFYKVRFINTGGWTGYGGTGHVVGGDIDINKTNRVEW